MSPASANRFHNRRERSYWRISLISLARLGGKLVSWIVQVTLILCAYLCLPLYALWILGGACADWLERARDRQDDG